MDLSKINTGEKIIGGSGIALLIFSFFPWLGFSYGPFSASGSAWKFTLCWFAVILGVLMAAYVIAKLFDVNLPGLGSIPWSQILLGVAALAFLLILIKLIAGPGTGGVNLSGSGVSKERKIGIFLGLLASAGLVAGAYLNAVSRGELPWGNKGKSAPPAA